MYKTAMEQNGSQWLGAPSCSRGSFAFYKSVSCRGGPAELEGGSSPGGPGRVWKLGGFYFVRCSPQEPVCIAEVTLLWEDQTQRHLLASSRLYFLPEDTPRGRTRDHGEDEVIAVSKRIVVRVDDLAKWACTEPPLWRSGRVNGSHQLGTTSPSSDAEQSKENTQGDGVGVRVLSYPQYCRYRSLRKRVEELGGSASAWQQEDPHLKTLEDIRASMVQQNTRVLYCRDIFTHPTLNNNTSVLAQLGWPSLRLKGRPRKRRGIYARIPEQSDLPQGEGWKEQMNDTVLGDAELQWSGGWMQHPEQQLFLDQLFSFMERRGSPIGKVPNLGFKKIDLFLMYNVVKKLGGYDNVTNQRMWKTVYNELGGSPGSTSAATCTRRHYERLMLPFEQSLCSGSKPASAQVVLPKRPRGRPPLHLQKKNSLPPPAPTPKPPVVTVDGVVVVKRGRGRPPGRRKLMAARANSNNNQQGSTPLQPAPPPSQVKAAPPIPTQGPDAPLPSPALPNSTLFQAQVSTPTSATSTPPLAPQSNSIKQETEVVPTTPQLGRPVTRFNGVPRATSSRNASESATSKLSSGPSQTLSGALAPTMPKSSSVSQAELAPPAPSASKSAGFSQGSSPTAAAAPAAAVVVVGSSSSPTVFSPTKGLCPLDLFRTKMGLGAMAQALDSASSRLHVPSPSPSSVSRHPVTPSGPGTSSPTSTPTPTSTSTPVRPADAQPSPALQHQRSGSCTNDQGVLVEVGPSAAAAVLQPQPQPQPQPQRSQPPLRILPLELGCSLQVRQLMLNSLSSEHVQCFTKRLSEALADAGPTPQAPPSQTQTHLPQSLPPSATPSCSLALASPPNPSAPITSSPQGEQAQPLNLTMWGAYKRPADGGDHPEGHRDGDDNGPRPPVAKLSRLDKDGLPLMHNVGGVFRFPLFQDQPADLSLPCRLRAILRDSRCLSAKSPDRSERHRHSTPLRAESTPLRAESTPMKLESTPLQTESTGIDPLDPSCRTEVSSRAVEEVQGGAVGLVDGAPVEVKEEGGGVSPGGVLHSGGGDGSGGTPMEVDSSSSSSSSSKEAADVPSTQRNGATDRGAALENRADVSRVGHGELSNGKAGASGDQEMLTNGDLASKCSHEELANGQSDAQAGDGVQAAGRPDIQDCHMPRTNGDRDTDHEHVASANGHSDARDEQMQLASEHPDICNDHIALANRQSDAHDAQDELANGHSDACTEHLPLVNGDASTEIKASDNGDLDAHDEQLQLANGHSDVHDEEIELANGEPDACEESMLFANGDSDAHNKLMALASGDSDVHEDEDHETYTEGSFISLVLPESPPHSHCNSISNTLLS
ncbi:mucin-5AC isoform X2 [Engraulis encrasicolus]|uniref:mucin-5AC isoform X2 n=1 Tax=Engraulis encrasicolus TaxID=184585 RepID=UPI002FD7071C